MSNMTSNTINKMPGWGSFPGPGSSAAGSFDPTVYLVAQSLNHDTPSATMESMGLKSSPLTSTAFTGPFPFLTPEAVRLHRQAILQDKVLENCMSSTWAHSVQLRGMTSYSSFIKDLWNSKEAKDIVSKAAGTPLVPVFDYEICHANVQVKPVAICGKTGLEQLKELPVNVSAPPNGPEDDVSPLSLEPPVLPEEKDMVVDWHTDCYPFVTILMLSPPQGMKGGETVVRNGDGSLMFVKAPEIGQLLVFQGGRIEHAALPAMGSERITLVTSWRHDTHGPNVKPLGCDTSHLGNVRRYSRLSELYAQWTLYRLDIVAQEINQKKAELEAKYLQATADGGLCKEKLVDLKNFAGFIDSVTGYLRHTVTEMPAEGEYAEEE